ncbi:hypothetical protein V6N11_050046 [Hibiscus sabdariffa]|uniref:Uncharacterized protein n=1 Tax=Hibiscus sabdariffa TaxID=183260 RepID=A0ABR2T9P3_9ROSI
MWQLGSGVHVLFWQDRWCTDKLLSQFFPQLFHLAIDRLALVRGYVVHGSFDHHSWGYIVFVLCSCLCFLRDRGLSLGEMELGCLWFRHGLDEMHSLWVVFFVPQWWRVDCEMSTSLLEFLHQSIYGVFSCAAHQW